MATLPTIPPEQLHYRVCESMGMTLRRRAALILALATLATSAGVYILSSVVLGASFSELEQEYARRDVDRALNAVEAEVEQIDVTVADWASWDATYQYMWDRNRAYEDENLQFETLEGLNLDYLVLIGLDGRLVTSRSIERNSGTPRPLGPDLMAALEIPARLPPGEAEAYERSGVLVLPDGPLLFALRPVLQSDDRGPVRGYLLMGRYLDEETIAALSDRTVLDLTVTGLVEPDGRDFWTAEAEDNQLVATGLITTENERGVLGLEVTSDRDIAREGRSASLWMLGVSIAGALVFGLLIFGIAERKVIRRLRRLGQGLAHIAETGEIAQRVQKEGGDEVGKLAADINRMLDSLEQSSGRYETLVSSTPEAIFLVRDGVIEFANPAGIALARAGSPLSLKGEAFETLVSRRDREAIHAILASPEGEAAAQSRIEVALAGAGRRRADLVFVPVKGTGLWQVSGRDVTDARAQDERERTFERRMQEAQRLESLGLLAGGIAHDFNNILLAVAGNAAIAKLDVAPKSAAMESISEIETATFRAADLTRQLLAYAGSGQLMVRNVEVAELVRDTVKLVRRVSANFVVVEVDAGSDPVYIEGDDVQLRQVVMNLVTNAYDALADSAGRMQVCSGARHFGPEELALVRSGTIVTPGHYAFISVEDDGPGIPPERLSRIFEPFYSTKGAGRGLGLAAVIGIVNAHRGAIMVETEEDQGTTFTVLFPVAASGKTGVESLSR